MHSVLHRRARAYHVIRFVFIASPVHGPVFIAIRGNKPSSFLCYRTNSSRPPTAVSRTAVVFRMITEWQLSSLSLYIYIIHKIINKTRFAFQTICCLASLIFSLRIYISLSSFLTTRVWPVDDNISYRDNNKRQLVQCLPSKPVDLPSRRRIADTASAHTSSVIILSANVSGRSHNS